MYGEGMNAFPYILASYGIGAVGILGYGVWLIIHRRRTLRYLAALSNNSTQKL